MNFLAAFCLLVFHFHEEDAFWLFLTIVDKLYPSNYFTESMLANHVDQYVFVNILIPKYLPNIYQHVIQTHQIQLNLITSSWFLCGFLNTLKSSAVLRVWDIFLNEGSSALFAIALGLLKMHEKTILSINSSGELFCFIRDLGIHVYDVEELIHAAFGNEHIVMLNKNHSNSGIPPPPPPLVATSASLTSLAHSDSSNIVDSGSSSVVNSNSSNSNTSTTTITATNNRTRGSSFFGDLLNTVTAVATGNSNNNNTTSNSSSNVNSNVNSSNNSVNGDPTVDGVAEVLSSGANTPQTTESNTINPDGIASNSNKLAGIGSFLADRFRRRVSGNTTTTVITTADTTTTTPVVSSEDNSSKGALEVPVQTVEDTSSETSSAIGDVPEESNTATATSQATTQVPNAIQSASQKIRTFSFSRLAAAVSSTTTPVGSPQKQAPSGPLQSSPAVNGGKGPLQRTLSFVGSRLRGSNQVQPTGGFPFTDEDLLMWRSTALIEVEEEYSELMRMRKIAKMNVSVDDLESEEF